MANNSWKTASADNSHYPVMDPLSIIVLIVYTSLKMCSTQQTSNVNVTISLGTITGLQIGTGNIQYFSFRGIPYANATRFKAPTPMQHWEYLVMATTDGAQCAQPSVFGFPPGTTEDCLFLNVYTPHLPQSSSSGQPKLPVMVFIHGGGFVAGSSNSHNYGPEFFMAENNVVLVTINYRLGIFGFLSTGTQDAQGNAGMKDQVEALRFVKNEISYFGGDPDSITIFGESAGAGSIVHHVLSPMSKGLFQRAIAQSGSALADWASIDTNTAREHATMVARSLGCNTENATQIVTCLRAMSASALCQASINILSDQVTYIGVPGLLAFRPVIEIKFDEEVFLADHPVNILKNMTEAVPLIIGTNKDEGVPFLPDDDTSFAGIDKNLQNFVPQETIEQATPAQLNAIVQQMREYYFKNGPVNQSNLEGLVNLLTDQMFTYSTAQTVRNLAEKHSTVYLYRFAYSGSYKTDQSVSKKLRYNGVIHGEELGYFFYSSIFKNTDLTQTATEDYQTMKRMVKLWTAFATKGTPSSSTDEAIRYIHWPQVTNASELNYLEMETNFTIAMSYYKERIALWDQLTNLQRSSAFTFNPTIILTLFSLILIIISCRFSV